MRKRFFIFIRAFLMITLTSSNIRFISSGNYVGSVMLSACISTMWTLNIRDLAISNWGDRLSYILGGVVGTSVSLFLLSKIF